MRSREEIKEDWSRPEAKLWRGITLIVEILLDIRDLLAKQSPDV